MENNFIHHVKPLPQQPPKLSDIKSNGLIEGRMKALHQGEQLVGQAAVGEPGVAEIRQLRESTKREVKQPEDRA
jgi:hypothetical protein